MREGIKKESGDDDPDWVIEADVKRKVDEFDLEERELEVRLELIREKEKKAKAKGKIVNRLLNNSIYDESSLEGSSKRRVSFEFISKLFVVFLNSQLFIYFFNFFSIFE